ncbi:MAG: EAL domain-containing protein [Campylobacterales bacterium]|nr:EAL domain-containing protein [Campylobacterales bacterium]
MEFSVYVARQPIFDEKGQIFAYELLYRNTGDSNIAEVDDNLHATARVLVNTLNYIGLDTLTRGHPAFIKVDGAILRDDIIDAISPAYFILEILESTVITTDLLKRIEVLHAKGYRFALNRYHYDTDFFLRFRSLLGLVDYVKIDLQHADNPAEILSALSNHAFTFIAEKIEDKEAWEKARSYGFNCFQGYYFSTPDLLKKENFDPDSALLLDLIYLLKTRAPLEELLAKFDTSPYLALNLLKFIQLNEGFSHDAISSVEQALVVVGRERLGSWLELMFYADGETGVFKENLHAKQITQQALQRAYLMEELAYITKKSTHLSHMAYITGILSMTEMMFHDSYAELLKQINVNKQIEDALLHRKGDLGRLLELVIAIEKNDLLRISAILLEMEISERELNKSLLNSYHRSSMALNSPVHASDLP